MQEANKAAPAQHKAAIILGLYDPGGSFWLEQHLNSKLWFVAVLTDQKPDPTGSDGSQ